MIDGQFYITLTQGTDLPVGFVDANAVMKASDRFDIHDKLIKYRIKGERFDASALRDNYLIGIINS